MFYNIYYLETAFNEYILYLLLRTICGPVYVGVADFWRRRKNRELREMTKIPVITSYIKRTKAKMVWACQTETSNKQSTRATTNWQPEGKRPD